MEQVSPQSTSGTIMSFDVQKYPLVDITRKFNAPVERVWQAWTTPQMVKEWWGPETYSCPEAKMDVRVGGKSLLAMKGPDGKVQYSGGTYIEVVPKEKLVTTDQFTDENGRFMSAKDAGMPGGEEWPDMSRITIEFKKIGDNESEIHLVHEGIPKSMHDDCVSGWSSSIDKLQNLVEQH